MQCAFICLLASCTESCEWFLLMLMTRVIQITLQCRYGGPQTQWSFIWPCLVNLWKLTNLQPESNILQFYSSDPFLWFRMCPESWTHGFNHCWWFSKQWEINGLSFDEILGSYLACDSSERLHTALGHRLSSVICHKPQYGRAMVFHTIILCQQEATS